ncbi:MAG TPA: type VI secretion system accessory protein TagJ [Gemmataceae bacterium]|nr:type VI secretion system accessory protein TagJ [Gemmataceae bacterium]
MNASELFKAGKLTEAVTAQTQEVKAQPGDQGKRLFLFELLAFAGDLERARRQIGAMTSEDPELAAATTAYRQLLEAEEARRRLFRDGLRPEFLIDPPSHVRRRLEAVNRLREGNVGEAAAELAKAEEERPATAGTLNGKAFDHVRDCDDLLAGVVEVMAQGKYFWLALEQIESLAANAPATPRDLLWLPAHLSVRNGPEGDVFLPALYPNSHEHVDDAIKLGRATDWKGAEGGPTQGAGLKLFLCGDNDISILEWRQLEMTPPSA